MTKEEIEVIARVTLEHYEAERKRQQKQKRDRRLRNTRLLLKHYRTLKDHCEGELNVKYDEDEVIADIDDQYLAINSITRSKRRTQQMISFIDQMLEVYRIRSEQSKDPVEMRRYKTIDTLFISHDKMSVDEVAKAHNVEPRTVYRDSKDAIYQLSCLIFGIDGLRLID